MILLVSNSTLYVRSAYRYFSNSNWQTVSRHCLISTHIPIRRLVPSLSKYGDMIMTVLTTDIVGATHPRTAHPYLDKAACIVSHHVHQ